MNKEYFRKNWVKYTYKLNHKQCNELKKILNIHDWNWKIKSLEVKQGYIRSSVTNTFKSKMENLIDYLLKNF